MINLKGKRALIFGVASETSIAWEIAKRLHQAGATIVLGYQQRFKSRILQLIRGEDSIPVEMYERCDVTSKEELTHFFDKVPGQIDILVHSIAFTNPATFGQRISEISQEDFTTALVSSAYSLIPLVHHSRPKFAPNASVMTLTYLGGQRVVANYKLMGVAKAALEATVRELASDVGKDGVRVNAISAGPIRTLAASQIAGFDSMLDVYEQVAPLRRSIKQEDVADMALFLASPFSKNISGQTIFVDAGYSTLAMAELPSK